MKKFEIKNETLNILLGMILLSAIITECDQNKQKATLGGSQDTSSVTRAGGPPIKDTATLNEERKKASTTGAHQDTTGKGNVDPTGHVNKPAKTKP